MSPSFQQCTKISVRRVCLHAPTVLDWHRDVCYLTLAQHLWQSLFCNGWTTPVELITLQTTPLWHSWRVQMTVEDTPVRGPWHFVTFLVNSSVYKSSSYLFTLTGINTRVVFCRPFKTSQICNVSSTKHGSKRNRTDACQWLIDWVRLNVPPNTL